MECWLCGGADHYTDDFLRRYVRGRRDFLDYYLSKIHISLSAQIFNISEVPNRGKLFEESFKLL